MMAIFYDLEPYFAAFALSNVYIYICIHWSRVNCLPEAKLARKICRAFGMISIWINNIDEVSEGDEK